jgi:YfiR/HmsC-like
MDIARRLGRTAAAGTVFGILAVSTLVSPLCAADVHSEDAIKAAYLYRFAGYVNWPEPGPASAPFTIDVLGSPGVAKELRRLLPGLLINNRSPQVREITGMRDLGAPQMVYVGAGRAHLLRSLVPVRGRASMLLVTDEEEGLTQGSSLNFLTVDRSVRFEVSLTAADRWGLKISSELLGVAIRVQGNKPQQQDASIRSRPGE